MDEIIDKVAGLGVGGVILMYVIATSGLTGVYALTAALYTLGFGWGMIWGIAFFGIASMLSAFISKYGIDFVAEKVVKRMVENGTSKQQIISDIDKMPWRIVCSKSLRLKVKDSLEKIKV